MIINVGGRTDIVQYYSHWLFDRFKKGYVYSRNPFYPNNVTCYDLSPSVVDCVVFCSKNYEPILPRLNEISDYFNTYYYYTITAYGKDIEPNVPDIDKSIDILYKLEKLVGTQRIAWRYDPVLLTKKYTVQKHLITFEHMAARLSGHVSRCIFSFVEFYKKLEFNMPELIIPSEEEMDEIAHGMGAIAKKYRIRLQSCATKADYSKYGILKPGCNTLDELGKANNIQFKDLKHTGMRHWCNCFKSNDIGAYDSCPNGCKYCYANQSHELAVETMKMHDPSSPMLIGHLTNNDKVTYARQTSQIAPKDLSLDLFS